MTTKKRVAIVGGGHNGLICGTYLAGAGIEVHIFEASNIVGGCCSNLTFDCGCTISRGANHFGMLHPKIREDLGLELEVEIPRIQTVVLSDMFPTTLIPITEHLKHLSLGRSAPEILQQSKQLDLELSKWSTTALYGLVNNIEEYTKEFKFQTYVMSARELLEKYFPDNDRLKNAVTAGTALYPISIDDQGSAFNLFYLAMYRADINGGWGHLKGGMGEISSQIAERFESMGGHLHLESRVTKISEIGHDGGKLVETESTEHNALFDTVVACIDPSTIMDICADLIRSTSSETIIQQGTGLKINGLLSSPPQPTDEFRSIFEVSKTSAFVFQTDWNCVHRRFISNYSDDTPPVWELIFPSLAHEADCCEDHFSFSIYANPFPYPTSDQAQTRLLEGAFDSIMSSVERYFPNFRNHIHWHETLTSKDFENVFGITYGNVDHGDLIPKNRYLTRGSSISNCLPNGVILGGSGAPPGGLVTGIPGFRAAQEILENYS